MSSITASIRFPLPNLRYCIAPRATLSKRTLHVRLGRSSMTSLRSSRNLNCAVRGTISTRQRQCLLEIDFDYLFLWGHFRLMAELHERLRGKLDDRDLESRSVGNLVSAYRLLGRVGEAIRCHEQALKIARQIGDRSREGGWLGSLALCYSKLGHTQRVKELRHTLHHPRRRG